MKHLVRFVQLFETLESSRSFLDVLHEMRSWFNDKIANILLFSSFRHDYSDFEDINRVDYQGKKVLFLPKTRRPDGKMQEIKPGRLAQHILSKCLPKFDYIQTEAEFRINNNTWGDASQRTSHLLIVPARIFTQEQLKLFNEDAKFIVPFDLNLSLSYRKTFSFKSENKHLKLRIEKVSVFSFLKTSFRKPFGEEVEGLVFYFNIKGGEGITTKNWVDDLTGERNIRLNLTPLKMRILPVIVSGREIEQFATRFESLRNEDWKLEKVSGEEIKFWYDSRNSVKVDGSNLVKSCMSDHWKADFLSIYTQNSAVKLLVLKNDEGKLLARALLWKLTESSENAEWFMDRVYYAHPSQEEVFFKWAIENRVLYYKNGLNLRMNKKVDICSMMIQLEKWDYNAYPYLDTFCILDKKSGQLMNGEYYNEYKNKNQTTFNSKDFIKLRSTSGGFYSVQTC